MSYAPLSDDLPDFPSQCPHFPCRCEDIDVTALLGRDRELCRENAELREALDEALAALTEARR